MREVVIATHNIAKIGEYRSGLAPLEKLGIRISTSLDFKNVPEPEETGKTFRENALLKARHYAGILKKPVIADDGGLAIDALGGLPGVYSRRWIGHDATDEELIQYTLKRLENVPKTRRTAAFEIIVCFHDPSIDFTVFAPGKIHGYVAFKPSKQRTEGFPYRALLKILPFDKYYDDLTEEEHALLNHRRLAIAKLLPKIRRYAQRSGLSH